MVKDEANEAMEEESEGGEGGEGRWRRVRHKNEKYVYEMRKVEENEGKMKEESKEGL